MITGRKKNEYKGERTVFSSLQYLGYLNISFVLLGICCVEILMYFDYKQYLLTRNIIWIHSHAESPSLANIMVIANSEVFLHSMLATLPGVASMVPRLGMIRLLNWDLVQAPFVQTLSTHRKNFPSGIFCDAFEEWTFPSQIYLCCGTILTWAHQSKLVGLKCCVLY